MPAPSLTQKQKDTFEKLFKEIIDEAPPRVKDLWDGNVIWVADIPHFTNNIHSKLKRGEW